MRGARACFASVLLALSLLPNLGYLAGAEREGGGRAASTELIFANNHTYSYANEPVNAHLSFSQGEAYNNSIRVYDSSGREVPSQAWNVEYYPGGKYVRSCNITFLADLPAMKETRYRVNYTSTDVGAANYSAWSDLRVSGDGFKSDVKVENGYFTAFVKANSTLGVFRFYLKPGNVSLIWGNSSLTGFTMMLDGTFYTANELKAESVSVVCSGPVFARVDIAGSVGGVRVCQSIFFYAHSPYVDSILRISNAGSRVDWIRPLQIFFRHGAYANYTLSTGESGSLERHSREFPEGNAYRPQAWWALGGAFGTVLFVQKPAQNISYIILHDTPTFTTVANVGNETLLNEAPAEVEYRLRIGLLESNDVERAKAVAKIFAQPARARFKLPVAYLSIEAPARVPIYTKFTVEVTVSVLQDLNNCTLTLSAPQASLNVSGKLSAYLGFLKKGSVRTVAWSIYGKLAGKAGILALLKSREGSANASTTVAVYIPAIAPPVKVKLRVVDFAGKNNMSLVNVTFLDGEGVARSNPPWVVTDKGGYAECSLEPGSYLAKVVDRGRTILAKNVTISGPASLTLNCWVYSADFLVLGPDGKALPESSRALVIIYENVSGKLVPVASAVSNETGYARISGIRNGTYVAKGYVRDAESGAVKVKVSSEGSVHSLSLRFLTIVARVVSDEGNPVGNCTVSIYDLGGRLVDMRIADPDGRVTFSNLAFQNYTYLVDWAGTRVASGFIYPDRLVTEVTIRSRVYKVTVEATDAWGNPLKGALVTVRPLTGRAGKTLVTNELGRAVFYASTGNYSVSVNSAGYVSSEILNVRSSGVVQVRCSPNSVIYVLIATSGSSWVALGLVWRWRTRGVSYEELKAKEMLAKLEDLYAAGEVEYPLYRKLKEEYSSQLRRVRTR
ncbi:MAG: carboxypeptidase regulatory-like domain-containing protein [Candidatus Brockarchaeota archaeon]|nr:carboxypeptidase regulatory-like domain-containing protein [Candidatus Brockarchaeota archaeon]